MNRMDVSVVGFGDNVVDKYEHIRTMYPGGNAANFSVYAKMCGAGRSAYMGIFGTDPEAEHVISALQSEGVELYKCRQLIGANGCARVKVIDGERIFVGTNEGGVRGEARYVLDRFDLAYIRGFDLLHTGSYCFTERELYKVKAAGVPVSFDFSDDSSEAYIELVAPFVDYAFMSCGDMPVEAIREQLLFVHSLGPKFACASRGRHGALAYDGADWYAQPAAPAEKVVDTMGAGDALISAFMVAYLGSVKAGVQPSAAIPACLQEASRFAARICGLEGSWGHPLRYEAED